jgi:cytochrome c-type biogenesis protein CcmH/NrfG
MSFLFTIFGVTCGFTIAKLMNNGYAKSATGLLLFFVVCMLSYLSWGVFQLWSNP